MAAPSPKHAFWRTQPVNQFEEAAGEAEEGPIEPPQNVEDVRQEPYNLPPAYEWCTCDVDDDENVGEVYRLLNLNYVEDDDNMFRFDYSKEFLRWALRPPGYFKSWFIGVRAKSNKKLVAFISGIPQTIQVRGKQVMMAEINFLCVHKRLRAKRLAPVLIREITRRVHLENIWQATYTAGVVLPKPVATCRYYHRSLKPKKLIEVGFSRLQPRMTLARTIKLFRLPDEPLTKGFREMERHHVPQVTKLVQDYLSRFQIAPVFNELDIQHLLLPIPNVVNSYVVEDEVTGEVTDFCSFYTLPSTIIGNKDHSTLRAAYSFYNVANVTPLSQLLNDALIMAKNMDYDVFNALDIMDNEAVLKDLKFGPGDGQLHYYLYNWRLNRELKPEEVGLVLL